MKKGSFTDVDAMVVYFGGIFGILFPCVELEGVGFLSNSKWNRWKCVQLDVWNSIGFGLFDGAEGRGSV